VFQFPVIYDTMTVAQNLAFPLRNRGVPADRIQQRVAQIAELLDMSGQLDRRAAGLSADAKQKISLGRGLVREDVSAVLFDEPLTVIDPHLKWQLRRKLKQIHAELKLTLIYVTHDQVEALTFAQQVVVMTRGRAVQIGSASELFERPRHTFVGNFIGSPGMNFLPARGLGDAIEVAGRRLPVPSDALGRCPAFTLGIRPEYVKLAAADAAGALPGTVTQAQDIGTYWLVTASVGAGQPPLRARLSPEQAIPKVGESVWLGVVGPHTCYYVDEELVA
jgi:glycerol transport system ATP-binding protein